MNTLLSLFSICLMVLTEGFSPDAIYLIHNDDTAIWRFLRGNSHVGTAVISQPVDGLVADHGHLDSPSHTFGQLSHCQQSIQVCRLVYS